MVAVVQVVMAQVWVVVFVVAVVVAMLAGRSGLACEVGDEERGKGGVLGWGVEASGGVWWDGMGNHKVHMWLDMCSVIIPQAHL